MAFFESEHVASTSASVSSGGGHILTIVVDLRSTKGKAFVIASDIMATREHSMEQNHFC